MSTVASRELRNETRALLDRVARGEEITITVDGRPAAVLVPPRARPRWMRRERLLGELDRNQADAGLRDELAELAPDLTDELPL